MNNSGKKIAQKLRIHAFRMTTEAHSDPPTMCSSSAELMACLFFDEMRYNIQDHLDVMKAAGLITWK